MKPRICTLAAVALLLLCSSCDEKVEFVTGDLRVTPLPQAVEEDMAVEPFVCAGRIDVIHPEGALEKSAAILAGWLDALSGAKPVVTAGSAQAGGDAKRILLRLDESLAEDLSGFQRQEYYELQVSARNITLSAVTELGILHGVSTLVKALPMNTGYKAPAIPAGTVRDFPQYEYRGFMLDVGRHFFDAGYVKTLLDILALHNINYFHWHLTEDQGWRIEIKKYPRLTEVGSFRAGSPLSAGKVQPTEALTRQAHDGIPVSGFYTQEEIREVVAYAAERGITVIPEIDLPGHMKAALASYPELGCTGGPYEVATEYGVLDDVLCVGKEGTLRFVEDVLEEVLELFPSEYIHLGGDECPKVRWRECPHCQAKIRELGLRTEGGITAEDRLQSWFMAEAERFLASRGRKMIGWNDILCDWSNELCGTPAKSTVVQAWMRPESAAIAAREGYKTIISPVGYLYFSNREQNRRRGLSSISRVYEVPFDTASENVIGLEACIWTERVPDTPLLEWELLPRLAALSELQWSSPAERNLGDFITRLEHMTDLYTNIGWNWKEDIAECWEDHYWKGADIGWATEMAARGLKLYNRDGEERECTALMKELGLDAVRFRVWVDPSAHGDWNGLDDLLVKARRAHELGMAIMIDFHYSDFWADPKKQNIPAAWSGHSYEEIREMLAAHTREVLSALKAEGISPRWVQVGNEISNGFLWTVKGNEWGDPVPDAEGRVTILESVGHLRRNPSQYAGLFAVGYDAVKEVFPEAEVIVHLDNGFDRALYDSNLDTLLKYGARWDIVGMSLYPFWALDSGLETSADEAITHCMENIEHVWEKYGTPTMIVETGFEVDEARPSVMEAGRDQLARIIRESRATGHCNGIFYWEPECRPEQYHLGAFTSSGRPTVIMDAFVE